MNQKPLDNPSDQSDLERTDDPPTFTGDQARNVETALEQYREITDEMVKS